MSFAAEHLRCFLQPLPVNAVPDIVAHEHDEHASHRCDEQGTNQVVHVLGNLRKPCKSTVTY